MKDFLERKLSARYDKADGGRNGSGGGDPARSSEPGHLQSIAETILRTAKEGERDPATLQRMALLELQIRPRD